MTLYKSKQSQPLKFVIALLVFLIAMSLTWSEVSGYENDNTGTTDQSTPAVSESPGHDDVASVPSPVPEPGTLILLGSGLGALYLMRKRRPKKR